VIDAGGKFAQKPGSAEVALDYLRRLHALEKAARKQEVPPSEHCLFRREKAEETLNAFKAWMDKQILLTPPKGLLVIERCFRALIRTRIKMEPMHHGIACRIKARIKLSVFALLIERVAEIQCKQPWPRIKRILATLRVSDSAPPIINYLRLF
jgi:hypothetical protein